LGCQNRMEKSVANPTAFGSYPVTRYICGSLQTISPCIIIMEFRKALLIPCGRVARRFSWMHATDYHSSGELLKLVKSGFKGL